MIAFFGNEFSCAVCNTKMMACDHFDRVTLTCPNGKCKTHGQHYKLPTIELEPTEVTDPRWLRSA